MTTILFLDGTWSAANERSVASVALAEALPDSFGFAYVAYPAQFGPATGPGHMSHEESVQQGVRALTAAVMEAVGRVVVAGYSQGAEVAVRFVRDILPKLEPEIRAKVVGLATMGDPHQPVHDGNRSGILEPISGLGIWTSRRFVLGDPIADLSGTSLLRVVAPLTKWMAIRSHEDVVKWGQEALAGLGQLPWWTYLRPWAISSAAREIGNYLGTAHTTDYAETGVAAEVAHDITAAFS
ncbi:lysin B [Gordonia phage Evaa]|nr:lysin B [Gordonia phage Evaa]